jgi:peptide/nickel transport system permease protein
LVLTSGKAEEQNDYLSFMNRASPFLGALWHRFKKNKGGVFGLVLIILSIIIALFGYFIAPDPSPYANRIILEIGGERPGFTQSFLLVKRAQPGSGILQQAFSGKRDQFEYIPVQNWNEKRDSLIVE